MSRIITGAGSHSRAMTLAGRFRYLLLLSILFAGSFIIFTSMNTNFIFIDNEPSIPWSREPYITEDPERYTINTEGCSIPAMEPINDSVKKYVKFPNNKQPCPNSSSSLLAYNKNKIWIVKDLLPFYKAGEHNITCCYQAFYRPDKIDDITSFRIDHRTEYDKCIYFNDSIRVTDEFVKVTCRVGEKKVFVQYYPFAIKKKFSEYDEYKEMSENKTAYNVLVLGIDSVSRLNFHRTMPKSLEFLKKSDAVELLGYNKVGDNTFPNVIPMLMGVSETQLPKICLPQKHATFDNCPFIWNFYKQAGYYTAFAEDCSSIGTFTYQRPGFIRTPTDYYFHTFIHNAEHNVGTNKDFNAFLCMRDKYFYQVLLEYIENLTETLEDSRLFGFFWEATMTHDYLNYPMVMDEDYLHFFESLENSGYLNKSIVFVLSDHGMRWGPIRSTLQGRLEERLPFVYILTPPSFKENYVDAYENLKLNSRRLSTPYDIYATLNDLIDLNKIVNKTINKRARKNYWRERSISLFLPIPSNRTCAVADIDDHWCTCHKQVSIPVTDPDIIDAAINLVMILNNMLIEYPQCAQLTLVNIERAIELVSHKSVKENEWREFLIVVKTKPGNGIFEATLRNEDDAWSLSGTVSRLNIYGDQSRCVHNNQMKLYCYCS